MECRRNFCRDRRKSHSQTGIIASIFWSPSLHWSRSSRTLTIEPEAALSIREREGLGMTCGTSDKAVCVSHRHDIAEAAGEGESAHPAEPASAMQASALVVAGAGALLFSCFGTAYAVPVFFPALSRDLAIPLPQQDARQCGRRAGRSRRRARNKAPRLPRTRRSDAAAVSPSRD